MLVARSRPVFVWELVSSPHVPNPSDPLKEVFKKRTAVASCRHLACRVTALNAPCPPPLPRTPGARYKARRLSVLPKPARFVLNCTCCRLWGLTSTTSGRDVHIGTPDSRRPPLLTLPRHVSGIIRLSEADYPPLLTLRDLYYGAPDSCTHASHPGGKGGLKSSVNLLVR